MNAIYPTRNSEHILVHNASKTSSIEKTKAEMKVDALRRRSSRRQAPMTPTSGSTPNISGNMSSEQCHRSLAETARKLEFLDPQRFYKTTFRSPWWYGVILPQSNQHSLASALSKKSAKACQV